MTAIGKLRDFGICNPPRNTMNLLKRTIFIFKSLHRKHRTTKFSISFSIDHSRNSACNQISSQPQKAESGSAWLPSANDRGYVTSLMGRVVEVRVFAN